MPKDKTTPADSQRLVQREGESGQTLLDKVLKAFQFTVYLDIIRKY
jgi:hypothetical protein